MTRRDWLTLAGAAAPAFAQDETVIRVDVELVNLLFTVRDRKGALISTVEQKEVQVLEDGKAQTIRQFTRDTNLPLTIGLLVDVSRSQENLIEVERRAAAQFFKQLLKERDMAFIIGFGSEAELLQDYSSSPKLLTQALDQLRVDAAVYNPISPGPVPSQPRGTILYDAIFLAADEKLKGEVGRKVIVVISDGMDQGSRKSLQQALESAHKADAIIYCIYYVDPTMYHYQMYGVSDSYMKKLAEETGGRLFRVDRRVTLEEAFRQIEEEMRSQYALSYTPSNPNKDGGYRKLEIRVQNKDYKVQARKGYFATKA
jgi:VWFA-related protein